MTEHDQTQLTEEQRRDGFILRSVLTALGMDLSDSQNERFRAYKKAARNWTSMNAQSDPAAQMALEVMARIGLGIERLYNWDEVQKKLLDLPEEGE